MGTENNGLEKVYGIRYILLNQAISFILLSNFRYVGDFTFFSHNTPNGQNQFLSHQFRLLLLFLLIGGTNIATSRP